MGPVQLFPGSVALLTGSQSEQAGQVCLGPWPSFIADLPGGVGHGGADVWLLRSLEGDERPEMGSLWEDSTPSPDEPHDSCPAYLVQLTD